MSLQTIIDNATFITVDKKKLAGQSLSRSGVLLTSTVASAVPYRFVIGMHDGLKYSTNRDLLEELDRLDITIEENVDIGTTNTGLSYITAQLGTLAGSPTITSASASNIVLNTTSATGSGDALKKGDFIQPDSGYRYPYQVTADVTWNACSITVPIHRPFIDQSGYTPAGNGVLLGSAVTWNVKMTTKPKYSIVVYDRIVFDSDFELVEVIQS